MSRRLVNLTLDTLEDVLEPCRSCLFWERDASRPALRDSFVKQQWVSETLLEWGSCGQLLYVDGALAGHALYAPPAYVPRAAGFPTSPIGADAVLLMTARINPGHAGGGLGRMLLQGVARDVTRRGVKAIEVFGRSGSADPDAAACLLPVDFLLAVGFRTVRPHPRTPRMRMEIRSLVSWREDVESAWERLLGSIQVPGLTRT